MSGSNPSREYFEKTAGQWDELRSGYFKEAVRDTAISKAYLRSEMIVADVGAGTGFISAGLAPLVKTVYALDGSPAMLEVARENLAQFDNIIYEPADGLALSLPDKSLDAVFANMYLHHCPDPLAAIREMVRVLRPGGRLVITDLDAHTHAWMKTEMADVWLGFERDQVRSWFAEAGLVNRIVDCTGQSCCASESGGCDEAQVSVFVAVGTRAVDGVEDAVREGYSARAEGGGSCCSPKSQDSSCCSEQAGGQSFIFGQGYTVVEQGAAPEEALEIALGCGNPTALAGMKPGEVVVDIGSGGGIDAFLAAKKVGKTGKVIGVDMTPAMLARARKAAEKGGYDQVEFRQGQAESLPVEDGTADVVISNCVINLTRDKGKVFSEVFRVLRDGGRLEVSDMVSDGSLPVRLGADPEQWAGCISGALPEGEYVDLISQAGFGGVVVRRSYVSGEVDGVKLYSVSISAHKGMGGAQAVRVVDVDNREIRKGCCGG